ncbi:hypothetical protein DCAR_0521805 [Daucus carota subsp. sativus]|uniref:Pentatricopeptide repeat-containing protein n=1 Tax=Daucus carota subsp. sativus TaxID=79200 RepID=A0AAF0X9Q2_DAUCS|nr:PREDICTED: putative pentatricopeptide repeat-containing protein At3g47840 [Daucus carota subsp. sativus]XP_017250193.1 PREDICTED: putative pentatricopeptide repeat-containing protein At3g47840 [Daucus carota subsp. sativus]XP_017250194.1 PREDICTED: putative pentatricopeptide repeat-containing protein At3g47840 [Daucus carota subsp. sativus]XP_017250195.1 PREDICTED: putative pentatricopeptide repeat-containing protein At3g47840 [Daucus carota subsp. sativus]WOH02416.1 hypothetical protein DCA
MMSKIKPYITRRLYTTAASNVIYSQNTNLQFFQHQTFDETHHDDMFEVNYNLKELVKGGILKEARYMFDKLPHRDEVTWTSIISGYVHANDSREALLLFAKMWVQPTLRMDSYVLSLALKACALNVNVQCGECLHGYCVKSSFVDSVFVGSALVDMYTKVGKIGEGCRVFDQMVMRNVVSWTAIITGLVHAGYSKEGLGYFTDMWREGVEYDSYTFAIALKACADIGLLNQGREIHAQTMKRGFDFTSFVVNTLAAMYNKCGKLHYGLYLFKNMRKKDVVSWTNIITTYVQMGEEELAIEAFLQMRGTDVSPNEYTFAAVIAGCANASRNGLGQQLHAHVYHIGLFGALSVANSVMTMYAKCGLLDSASAVFYELTRRDVVSWSTIISGYAQGGCGDEAFKFLILMRRVGPKPTEFALASVLSVSGNLAILEQGKQLHAHALSIGLDHTAMIRSGLINMYTKCGSLGDASKIFLEAYDNDIVSLTAMINGYAEHGYSEEAFVLFDKIPKVGLRPDSVTFIGVLIACSHAGLVDRGFYYFNLMSEKYKIKPSKEHYGCMIDLLCRAGRLAEAENMITTMPFQQDDVVWSTLLRACRVHGDVECASRAAQKILEIDPNCAGTHITLANIYSAKGRWKEAAKIRKLMRLKGLIKEPGWSWIKVKDWVVAFVAGDRSHPQCEDIYCVLELLASMDEFVFEELGSLVHDDLD